MTRDPADEAFLSRWSRLKREEPAPEVAPEPVATVEAAPPEETDAELLARLGLPDPADLVEGDDVSGFMSAAVPARLRRLALRRLWRLNPALGYVDGLLDYNDDFTDAATVVENMQTVYEVGKGAARKYLESVEAARRAEAEAEPEEAPDMAEEEPPAEDEPAPVDVAALDAPPPLPPPPPAMPESTPEPAPAPAPRRTMRFSFAETA